MKGFSLFNWDNICIDVPTIHGNEKLFLWSNPDISQLEEVLYLSLKNDFRLEERLENFQEIWIKPNITGMNRPDEGKTSHPVILEKLIIVLKRFTTKKIVVADSSVIGIDSKTAAVFTGIFEICERHGIPFIDLREVSFKKVKIENYFIHSEIYINEPFFDNKIFKINLAKIKTTYGSPVGMCLKNTKGIIKDDLKYSFHIKGLQKSICDLAEVVKWDLSVIEGFPISELGQPGGNGPFGISTNPVVLDFVICLIFKVPMSDIFHIEYLAKKLQITESFFKNNKIINQIIDLFGKINYSSCGLKVLEEKFGLIIENGDACSGCVESLAKALKKINPENLNQKRIILGAQFNNNMLNCSSEDSINCFVGNCSFDRVGIELERSDYSDILMKIWHSGLKIQGCPPTIDDMVSSLSNQDVDGKNNDTSKSLRIEKSFNIRPIQISLFEEKYKQVVEIVPKEKISFSSFGQEVMLACEVIAAAICHQINWDFLRNALFISIKEGAIWWQPDKLHLVDESIIQNLLSDYDKPERIRAKERSEMIRSLNQMFNADICNYRELFSSHDDLYLMMCNILKAKVFSEDPEQKKLQVLLHNIARVNIIDGIDALCKPAIDYHIMRLYIRRGDITPNSSTGYEFLNNKISRKANTVAAFRSVVANALNYSSFCTKLPIPQINYIDWWIGRSVCLKDNPNCTNLGNTSKWLLPLGNECPFLKFCYAFNHDKTLLKIEEPQHFGRFY